MKYTLMHKNIEVINIEIDETSGYINKIMDFFSLEHLPFGVTYENNIVNKNELNHWWINRSIPVTRGKIQSILQELYLSSTRELLPKCYGLSLSDHYWIRPFGTKLEWEKINFFENEFTDDFGDLLVGNKRGSKNINLFSPDNTTEGKMIKKWEIINGERILLKSGSGITRQEVFNEKIASYIMSCLGIEHVDYFIYWDKDVPYSGCKDFLKKDEDFVSAWYFLNSSKNLTDTSQYSHLIKLGEQLDIKELHKMIDKMLVLDYIILNEDRHLNNFGFIRDVNTLKIKKVAPIFDNGSSLGYNTPTRLLNDFRPIWKPFKSDETLNQLTLISDFHWIDFEKLKNVHNEIIMTFMDSKGYVDETRAKIIADLVDEKIESLALYAKKLQ